ncbi:ParB N-terminal domain-containing protein [Methylopila sp. M107]|uniref:ParB/RepB/Spo0J family partition protein n=1 Tax=Methylopila sp. M107 TaxID=1101190 RepID=UPI000363EBDE|nr:ParB N-terminal domain-containing protein [Methylopila sp. M107]
MTSATLDTLSLDLIDVNDDRLRPLDVAWAEVLAASMAAKGLTHRIVVRPSAAEVGRWSLVAGRHRLAAAGICGWTEIPVEIRSLTDAEARLVEIDENLMRRELSALDRAIFLSERKRVWEDLYPQVAKGGDQKVKQIQRSDQNDIMSFSSDVADRTGLSRRTIQRSIALVADLSPEVIAAARGTYLENHAADLAHLANLRSDEQIEVAKALSAGRIKRVGEFRAPAVLPADERQFNALVEAWSRGSEKARRRFLAQIGAEITAKGVAKSRLAVVSSNVEDVA